MNITVNGTSRDVVEPLSLAQALSRWNYQPQRVVVELNGEIVKRERWPEIVLRDSDCIEVIAFVSGGAG